MSAGLFYTVAVTDSGVYSWGDNSVGALGLGDTEDRDLPCLVRAVEDRTLMISSSWPQLSARS